MLPLPTLTMFEGALSRMGSHRKYKKKHRDENPTSKESEKMCDYQAMGTLNQGETVGNTRNCSEARACFTFYTVFAITQ